MKIVLICPTWTDDLGIFAKLAKKRNSQPPLGILYLATIAEQKGHKVRVIDADVEDYDQKSLADAIVSEDYDLVGITATSPIFHKAMNLAETLKSRQCRATIIIGGEHLNIFKKEAFYECFDYAFFGESDFSFGRFLDIMESGNLDFIGMKGFIYRRDGKTIETEPNERIKNLDEVPFPAMHLLRHDRYIMTFATHKKRPYLPLLATRGCPFKCAFCSEPLTNPYVRFRSAKNIVDEIERWVKEIGITHFFFMDSNITLKRDQIKGVCEEILARDLQISFEGWTRANLVDREILLLMKKAGMIRISYGIESGDPQILKIIRKEVALEDMRQAFKMTEEVGIEPACSVMLGLPGDTKASVQRTIKFVKSIPQIRYSNFSIANPYPGTEMYSWALEGRHGIRLMVEDFSGFRRYDDSPVSVNDMSKEDLIRLQKIGLLQIHFTPKRMLAAMRMIGLWNLFPLMIGFMWSLLHNVFRKEPAH